MGRYDIYLIKIFMSTCCRSEGDRCDDDRRLSEDSHSSTTSRHYIHHLIVTGVMMLQAFERGQSLLDDIASLRYLIASKQQPDQWTPMFISIQDVSVVLDSA